MRHFSVLLSAQSASNLNKNDQPLQALTRAATQKMANSAKARLMRGIGTAAILLLTIPPITDAAESRSGRWWRLPAARFRLAPPRRQPPRSLSSDIAAMTDFDPQPVIRKHSRDLPNGSH
jgi:hypothetical protein